MFAKMEENHMTESEGNSEAERSKDTPEGWPLFFCSIKEQPKGAGL